MPDDTQTPSAPLPPGLTPVPSEFPPSPPVPAIPLEPKPEEKKPVIPEQPKIETTIHPPVDLPPADPSALADLASSLSKMPAVDVASVPPSTQTQPSQPPVEPPPAKKSGRKTNVIIGALFLLILLPVISYVVVQRTNVAQTEPQAGNEEPYNEWRERDVCRNKSISCPAGQTVICTSSSGGKLGMETCECSCIPVITPTITLTITPTISLTVSPTLTPTITPTETPISTPTPTPPASQPGVCDASCGVDSDCRSGLVCATVQGVKRCRNPQCTSEFTCVCPATGTPIPTQEIVQVVVTAPTPKVPVSGTPAVLGAATVAGGILLLLLGLLL